jgi:uncharacterized protein with HEPN domain
MKPDDAAALVDVLNAARLIVAFRAGLEEGDFTTGNQKEETHEENLGK